MQKNLYIKILLEVVVESYGTITTKYFDEAALNSLQQKIKWADVVAIGPGLGREDETVKAVKRIFNSEKI